MIIFNVYEFRCACDNREDLDFTGYLWIAAESEEQALSFVKCVESDTSKGYGKFSYKGINLKPPILVKEFRIVHDDNTPGIIMNTLHLI